ncbi:MAG: SusC/RagA family TonB-linked outer membrane protein [Bacteroidales bacterium]|nr:SusC/RagA family TonB-linked outer membrane protein [Bacteroidales bacterium]
MKKVKLFLACLLAVASTALYAQNITVKGTVTDSSNGEPITGAAVVVQGSATSYALTDVQGAYSLSAPRNGVLVVSNMGYKTQSVEVNGMTVVNIALEPDAEYLDEVVVTAQGLTRKQKAIGYSAQVLSDEKLTITHSPAVGNALAGKVAGAQFWGSGGSTFNEGRIVLRGPTSYSSQEGSQPIYVVDGAIYGNANAVNMDDVESMNILKGPAATALYGSRGANGAVIITTKKAQEGASFVEFTQTTSAEIFYNHLNFQKLFGGGSMASQATAQYDGTGDVNDAAFCFTANGLKLADGTYVYDYGEDVSWGPRFDDKTLYRTALSWDPTSEYFGKTDTWSYRLDLRDLTRVAWTNNTNVSFTKATKGMNTRVSFSNVDRPGIFYNSKAIRRSFSLSSQIKPTNWLTADISYRFRMRRNQNASTEGYSANGNYICDFTQWGHTNVDIATMKDYLRPDGSWRTWNIVGATTAARYDAGNYNLAANFHDNPFAVMDTYNRVGVSNYHTITGDIYATLPYNFRLGARITEMMNTGKDEYKYGSGSINYEPYFRTNQSQTNDMTTQAYLTWSGQFAENRLAVEAAAFAEARRYDYYYLNASTNSGLSVDEFYNLAASNSTYSASNSETHYKTRSFFGNATIGWDDLIYLDGSIRYDLDSRLPVANNGYLYGGASLSFMASKLINAPWLNFWKIRGSLAQVGSTLGAYSVTPVYSVNSKFHGQPTMSEPTTQVNENIRPTISTSYEVGTEFKMFNNRFYGDINLYLKNTKDDIINSGVIAYSGYSNRTMNAGLVQNKGIEILLGGTPVKTRDWEWNITGNISKNVNTLVELFGNPDDERVLYSNKFYYNYSLKSRVGEPIGIIQTDARWKTDEEGRLILRKLSGNNAAAIGEVAPVWETNELKEIGNIQPDFTGGFSTDVTFKNVTIGANFDFVVGGQLISWTNMWGEGSGLLEASAAINPKGNNIREPVQVGGGVYMEGVDADGNELSGYMDAWYHYYYKYRYGNDCWLYDRSYLKMRELSVRYAIPQRLIDKLGIGMRNVSVAFVATNPWLIYSAVPNIDPSELGGASYNFLEGGQAISTRTFGITLKATFGEARSRR